MTGNSKQTKKYIQYLIEEIFFNTGELHKEYADYGKSNEMLGVYELYLALEKVYHFSKLPRFKEHYINIIIDEVYKQVVQSNANEDRAIIGFVYMTLDRMISDKQKNNESINAELFHSMDSSLELMMGIINDAKNLEMQTVSSDYIEDAEAFINDVRKLREKYYSKLKEKHIDENGNNR